MASARSASLRSTPGYTVRPTIQAAYPAPTLSVPSLPTVPQIDDARAPNAPARSWLQTVLGSLPGKYAPALSAARDSARAQLTGYGGVTFREDNPNTAEREDLQVGFDPNAPLGQRERNAINSARWEANARGMLHSGYADMAVGNALTRLNEEKRAIVNQFAAQINNAISAQATEATQYISQWTRLFGEDSRWLADNPPPAPPPPPPPPNTPQNPGTPDTWTPAQMQQAPARNRMSYEDFLRGRKSTRALAQKWDAEYNYNRRFGGR